MGREGPSHCVHVGGEELYLRRADDDARPRIFRDWIMSYRDRARCDRSTYEREHRVLIDRLFPKCYVLYRVDSEVHGWICGEPALLHYVYVPMALRRLGFAKAMVESICGTRGEHTHRRMRGLGGFAGWTYNPYRAGIIE